MPSGEIAAALREQREDTAARIAALDRSLAEAAGALGDLVRTEYAGELAKLGKTARNLDLRLDGLDRTAREQREAIGGLHGAGAAARRQRERLEELARQLDGIVARPAAAERQRQSLWRAAAVGVLAGLLLAGLVLWALPGRMETAAARAVMGDSYWNAAWRMMEAHGPDRARTLGVLAWIDAGPQEEERHRQCRDRARETGQPQQCAVTFRP